MKKFLISSIAAAAIMTGPALAADLPVKASAQPVAAVYSWTGFYIGGDVGWLGTANIGGPFQIPAAPGNSFIAPGVNDGAFGGFVGGQYQFGMLVVGAEAGVRQRFNDSFSSTLGLGNAPPVGCNAATVFSCQARMGAILQAGPRLGLAYDKFLVYGTGGWARTTLATQAMTNATGLPVSQASVGHDGWFAGGGIDWAIPSLTPGLAAVIGVDYTHYDFNTELHSSGGNARFVSTTADSVMVRFSLKYDPLVVFGRN